MTNLIPIADDVWGIDHDLRLAPGIRMPARATLVRLSSGELALHSPVPVSDALAAEIDALGRVACVIAPSCAHWLFARAAVDRWPGARVFAAPGLEAKLGGVGVAFEPLPASGRLAKKGAFGELRVQRVEGAPAWNEHVIFHEASRSLLVADLMFNVHRGHSFGMGLALRAMGVFARPAQSRAWRFLVSDRVAAAASASRVLAWEFERVVVAHGDVVEGDAHQHAERALAWMTGGDRPLLARA